MHMIQKHILKCLTTNRSMRFGDLKPRTIEGNQFTYHIKKLVSKGFIKSDKGSYSLTSRGRALVDRMSFETFKERTQPKIVTLLVLQDDKGEYLLYRRKRNPFLKKIGFPYGKIHLEERVKEAAERELYEKTGLTSSFTHRGDVYLTVHDETELITHMLCHVFVGTKPQGELISDTTIGECFWGTLKTFNQQDLIPGTIHIQKLIEKRKTFFFEEFFLNTNEE